MFGSVTMTTAPLVLHLGQDPIKQKVRELIAALKAAKLDIEDFEEVEEEGEKLAYLLGLLHIHIVEPASIDSIVELSTQILRDLGKQDVEAWLETCLERQMTDQLRQEQRDRVEEARVQIPGVVHATIMQAQELIAAQLEDKKAAAALKERVDTQSIDTERLDALALKLAGLKAYIGKHV